MVTDRERCPFGEALEILGRRHALSILWTFKLRSPRRFTDLRNASEINPATLSERLADLQAVGVLDRTVFNETPPRVEYDLTRKGRDLLVLLDDLESWSRKYPARRAVRAPAAARI